MPETVPDFEILDGSEVAQEILRAMGHMRIVRRATFVSYTLQDYSFVGHGLLSRLILKQLANGAAITLVTTPPPGKPTNKSFQDKYGLLRTLVEKGVSVFLNGKLHAKAYLFLDSGGTTTAIVGSPNLTFAALGPPGAPHERWVEMAVHMRGGDLFAKAQEFIEQRILIHKQTEAFDTWFTRHAEDIGKAAGG